MKKIACIAAMVVAAIVPGISYGQQFPSQPIKILVGFAPGGAPDFLARIVARRMSENMGQPFIVENRAGASGNIAANAVANSEPDGHTLLMATVSVAISASYQTNLPFSPEKDFESIGMVASVPLVLVALPELGVATVKDLLAHARANPGKLNYASVGNGSPQHLSGELFQTLGAVKLVHVPYKGGGPATQSVLAGDTSIFFAGMPPAMPFIRSGRLNALAVTSAKRSPAAPEIPTVNEAGLPGFEADNWHALLAAKGTPASIVKQLNDELQRVLNSPDVKEQMRSRGAEVWTSTPQESHDHLQAEITKWAKVVATAGVKSE